MQEKIEKMTYPNIPAEALTKITDKAQRLFETYKVYEQAWQLAQRNFTGMYFAQDRIVEKYEFIRTMAILDSLKGDSNDKLEKN